MNLPKSWDLLSHKTQVKPYKEKQYRDYTPVIIALSGLLREK
jgi:hypothetical protein